MALQSAIDQFLAAQAFYPCCLLIHPDISVLEHAKTRVVTQRAWPVVSCATVLSEALLDVSAAQRSRAVPSVLRNAVQQQRSGPVLLAEIDVLFEPSLSLDPLRLLRDISRTTPLVVLWPGSHINGVLAYATADPPHAHYRAWTETGLCAHCIVVL